MKVSTIGFTKKSAQRFFDLLRESGAARIVDVRIHNGSQLASFAKKDDLAWFARELCGVDYIHVPSLVIERLPTRTDLLGHLRDPVHWPDEGTAHRNCTVKGGREQWLSALQRGPTAPLSPAARRRVPEGALGRAGNQTSGFGEGCSPRCTKTPRKQVQCPNTLEMTMPVTSRVRTGPKKSPCFIGSTLMVIL